MKKGEWLKHLSRIMVSLAVIACALAAIKLFAFYKSDESESTDRSYQRYFNKNYKIFSLNLPDKMDFAGEEVPFELLDVREKFDRELLINTYWQSQSLLFHKRANRWFPVIEPILEKHGVPNDFKYLPVIESGLQNVVSPAGATGFWQLLETTAQEYGLEVQGEVDERYNVEKSTVAACKYLKDAYELYGSWTMAAASYNVGMAGLTNQVERQKTSGYYNLLLNPETARYVYRILAVKEILNKPTQYGFHFRPSDLYPPYETYTVSIDSSVSHFADFAFERGLNYKVLKILNPWLRDTFLTNPSGKTYRIKLPKEGSEQLVLPSMPKDSLIEVADTLGNDSI